MQSQITRYQLLESRITIESDCTFTPVARLQFLKVIAFYVPGRSQAL
jgi:hypothetical protein